MGGSASGEEEEGAAELWLSVGGALAQCRRSFGKSHGSVGGGYGGGQATAGERAVWVRDEAEGFVGVHGG